MMKKRGQLEVQFNWIFVLIAGGIILLMFFGFVQKQRGVSEQKLSIEVLGKIDSLFVGAGESKNTVNILNIPQIGLEFVCDSDGESFYTLEGSGRPQYTRFRPIFSKASVESAEVFSWTLEWGMPFGVTNFFMLFEPTDRFVFMRDGSDNVDSVIDGLLFNLPEQASSAICNFDGSVCDPLLSEVVDGAENVRLIFVDFNPVAPYTLPSALSGLEDGAVSAISLDYSGSPDSVAFFKKSGSRLVRDSVSVPLLKGYDEFNSSTYAAFFSEDREFYACNLEKALSRLGVVSRILDNKTRELSRYYDDRLSVLVPSPPEFGAASRCKGLYDGILSYNAFELLDSESSLVDSAWHNVPLQLSIDNNNLRNAGCPTIY